MTGQDKPYRVRVLHKVVAKELGPLRPQLNDACFEAEQDGMMLTGLVETGEHIAVAVFIGAEHFMYEMNMTTNETIEVLTEDLDTGDA